METKNTNTIRIFGGNIAGVPEAKPSLVQLFNVIAEMYMVVPTEYIEDVTKFIKTLGYVYKVAQKTGYVVFALQYVKS